MTQSRDLSRIRGSIVAVMTPMKNGAVDEKGFAELLEWHVTEGTHGIVPVGTTGESPTLSDAEHCRVIDICVEVVAGRVPVIAGTGSNNTAEALHYQQQAEKSGADAALVVIPYYNKPTQKGMYRHFETLAKSSNLPIIVYNVPARTACDISVETLGQLAKLPSIVGIKDATADISRVAAQTEACGEEFIQLSGEDGTALAFNAAGGVGCISVTANVAPKLYAQFQDASLSGDYSRARQLFSKLEPLNRALFLETSPAPVKWAVSQLHDVSSEVRLPLVEIEPQTQEKIRAAMVHAGVL